MITEREFQEQVTDLCNWYRLRYYHTHDSRRSNPGFPDLVIVGEDAVIYAELKSEKGRLTPTQREWIEALRRVGQPVYVWRPSDLARVKSVLTALSRGSLHP